MSLNDTPSGERVHIGFFGLRNAGKSSLVNAVTGQDLSVVSEVRGTTTDPVRKAMELLPMGPVVIADTPGFDDEGGLGELRVRKTKQELNRTDIAVLVVDACAGRTPADEELLALFREKEIPYLIVYNKSDLLQKESGKQSGAGTGYTASEGEADSMYVSALTGEGVWELKERIAGMAKGSRPENRLAGDLLSPNDVVVLVIPIDSAAPKGRIILPQQQVLRDVLDAGACAVCCKETELAAMLNSLKEPPAMVITDSQAFAYVAKIVPLDVPLTSFSILMARYKGFLEASVDGVRAINSLQDGDKVLISEGCTHHRQCDDIGSVKIPRWLREYTGKEIQIETSSGMSFPEDLSPYSLVIHCGGCMLGDRELRYRMKCAGDQEIPFTNYGITIAYMKGILDRSIEVLNR